MLWCLEAMFHKDWRSLLGGEQTYRRACDYYSKLTKSQQNVEFKHPLSELTTFNHQAQFQRVSKKIKRLLVQISQDSQQLPHLTFLHVTWPYVRTHLCTQLLIRRCRAPEAEHKGGVSSPLYVCSHCEFSLMQASSSMHVIALYTVSLRNGEAVCVCVFQSIYVFVTEIEKRKDMLDRKKKNVCVCVRDQPNKLHSCSLPLPLLWEQRAASNLQDKRKCRKQL